MTDFQIFMEYPVDLKKQVHYIRIHQHWDKSKVELVYEAVYDTNCVYTNIEHDLNRIEKKRYIEKFEEIVISELR